MSTTMMRSSTAAQSCHLFVAPTGTNGLDNKSNTIFATIEQALLAARVTRANSSMCTIELLSGGAHVLAKPLIIEPADSHTIFKASTNSTATISGGTPIPSACWTPMAGKKLACNPPPAVQKVLATRELKVLRVGNALSTPARFPDARGALDAQWCTLASSKFHGNNTFTVTVSQTGGNAGCIGFFTSRTPGWTAHIHIWPKRSWIDIHGASLRRLPPTNGGVGAGAGESEMADASATFELRCPDQLHCTDTSNSMSIAAGCRFHAYGDEAMLTEAGEWTYSPAGGPHGSPQLVLQADDWEEGDTPHVHVSVPAMSTLLWVRGSASHPVRNVSFVGLTFSDTDFDAQGGQEGFNVKDWPPGMPSDAAVRISDAIGVEVTSCAFTHLGGGGVHVGNRSSNVRVRNSTFGAVGQSGVLLTGDRTTQPRNVLVDGCVFSSPGRLLSSAAGVLASSASNCTFRRNVIVNSSRWGIAIRSNGAHAMSTDNTVELNRIEGAGQATRDLGGISLIGAGETRTRILSNCVKDVVGTDTNEHGELLRPFFTWSLYLDNDASGFVVQGNVLNGNVNGGVFFHGGRDNVVSNNVLANTNNTTPHASSSGEYGYFHAGSVVYRAFGASVGANNSFERNVVIISTNQSVWDLVDPFGDAHPRPLGTLAHNLYYSTLQPLATMRADRTGTPPFHWENAHAASDGTWRGWTGTAPSGLGWDAGSHVDVEPGFRSAASGDFVLRPDAAAPRLIGFEAIDVRILPC